MEHKGTDEYTGNNYRFEISNVEITDDFENTGAIAVQFTLTTSNGHSEFLEWADVINGESVDSHIKTNQKDTFHGLFYDKIEISTVLDAVKKELESQNGRQ